MEVYSETYKGVKKEKQVQFYENKRISGIKNNLIILCARDIYFKYFTIMLVE